MIVRRHGKGREGVERIRQKDILVAGSRVDHQVELYPGIKSEAFTDIFEKLAKGYGIQILIQGQLQFACKAVAVDLESPSGHQVQQFEGLEADQQTAAHHHQYSGFVGK